MLTGGTRSNVTKALDLHLNAARSTLVECGSVFARHSVAVLVMAVAGCSGEASRPGGPPGVDYAQVASVAERVPSPDYSVDVAGLAVQADASQVISTTVGSLGLSQGEQPGELYVIDHDPALGSSFASTDAAFAAGRPLPVAATIPAERLGLVGETLPTVLNVIILHAADGVKAYQVIRVTIATATF
jgi:hypothetical protein